jgi:hypothetical protein
MASSEMMSSSEMPMAPAGGKIPAGALAGGDVALAAKGSAKDGYGYVGVWATDAASCATIGQPGATGFAVITTASFRNGDHASYGKFGALADGKVTLKTSGPTVALEQSSPDALTIDGAAMLRCTP